MFKTIEVRNYKSIDTLKLALGQVNVFIGENGAGKSNILEAIALAAAANAQKLDNEFLASRGIRVTQASLMRPAFDGFVEDGPIRITVTGGEDQQADYSLQNDNAPYSQWQCQMSGNSRALRFNIKHFSEMLKDLASTHGTEDPEVTGSLQAFVDAISTAAKKAQAGTSAGASTFDVDLDEDNVIAKYMAERPSHYGGTFQSLSDFIIYSPENTALRTFEKEGQIEPLGINGEGILKLLRVLSENSPEVLAEIKASLSVLGWFKDFEIVEESSAPSRMEIKDKYLADGRSYFDQRSANEGFLFLVFYFALFSSSLTPKFFAVDNIDASLNPKLCQRLVQQLVKLAKAHGKQVLLTTHNPAILDGLNLDDDDQRLFAVSRNSIGYTRVKRIQKSKSAPGDAPVRLSEAFLRGAIGGLPKGF